MPVPAKSMAERGFSAFLGNLPQYSLCAVRPPDYRTVLQKRQSAEGSALSMDVADNCSQLWLLYSSGALGGRRSHDRYVDDSKDMRLCMDCLDWLSGHDT